MFICKIKDIKGFMNKLLLKTDFDCFAVSEAVIRTYNSFVIDGHLIKEHFSDEEWEALEGERFSKWEIIKPFCFQAIKGKKVPEYFKIVLLLSEKDKCEFMSADPIPGFSAEDVNGMYMNIRYEEGEATITTGTSLKIFTVDKALDSKWEAYVKTFFDKKEIDYEPVS